MRASLPHTRRVYKLLMTVLGSIGSPTSCIYKSMSFSRRVLNTIPRRLMVSPQPVGYLSIWVKPTFLGLNASHRNANIGQDTYLSCCLWNQRLRLSSAYRHHPQKRGDYRCQCLSDTAWNHLKVLRNIGLRISVIVHQYQLRWIATIFTHYFLSPFPYLKEGSQNGC